ncbi:alpha/beta fold hydrolase [Alkalicoccobacillus murimartini]|uniref:Alpha/beta hydrolase fold-5 domain-containing protein n=1 Tax=Alkalicoccobacillus murimartini TaxID=171685 RepID=A0ABT9YE31_9BACI|nr:alpha/beta fold hydrolase [Alkalicoccobacillus murimartini]MDQ0205801.1 hypothetical protein [Alkalicoccobacillus murimartini]
MKKIWMRLLTILAAIILLVLIAAIVWASFTYEATESAEDLSGQEANGGWQFGQPDAEIGIIFYQGAKVEPNAYNYLGSGLSEEGYFVFVPTMPFNLAVLHPSKASNIISQYPDIDEWYIGGHSLGGAMAAAYAEDHADSLSGLFLLGAYSANDLSDTSLSVLDISGGLDGLSTPEKMDSYEENLPEETTSVVIEQGNHANFGDYGPQKGDNPSPLTPEEQHTLVVNELTEWINK